MRNWPIDDVVEWIRDWIERHETKFAECDCRNSVLYHSWQASIDYREQNYPTIGAALEARKECVGAEARHDGLSAVKALALWDCLSFALRHDSGFNWNNNSR